MKSYVSIINEGTKAGKTNAGQGILNTMITTDLLHGGAYRWGTKPNKLPYYSPDVQAQISFSVSNSFWLGTLLGPTTIVIPPGYPGAGNKITLPAGASTLQAEVIIDSWSPHVLPQIISDQTYIQVQERAGQLLNTVLLQNVGTGVSALVEGITAPFEGTTGGKEPSASAAREIATLATAGNRGFDASRVVK